MLKKDNQSKGYDFAVMDGRKEAQKQEDKGDMKGEKSKRMRTRKEK